MMTVNIPLGLCCAALLVLQCAAIEQVNVSKSLCQKSHNGTSVYRPTGDMIDSIERVKGNFNYILKATQRLSNNCSDNLINLFNRYIYPICDEEGRPRPLCHNKVINKTIQLCKYELDKVMELLGNDQDYRMMLNAWGNILRDELKMYSNANYSNNCSQFETNNLYTTQENGSITYAHVFLGMYIAICVIIIIVACIITGVVIKYMLSYKKNAKYGPLHMHAQKNSRLLKVRPSTLTRLANNVAIQKLSKYNNKAEILERAPQAYKNVLNSRQEFLIHNDHIQLLTFLANGTFSEVYQGNYSKIQPLSGTFTYSTAIKRFKENIADESIANYIDKCLCLQTIYHPNVLKLVGISYDTQFGILIVYPYFQHHDLLTYVRKMRSHSSESTKLYHLFGIILQISLGMEALAKNNIHHKMLSAKTCLVNQELVVVVGDFSYANYYNKLSNNWSAPECLYDDAYTEKSDVWSFGVTGWEIMTLGEYPYSTPLSEDKLLHLIENGYRLQKPPQCPTQLYKLFQSCWNMQPSERPSFTEIVEKLHAMKEDATFQEELVSEQDDSSEEYLAILPEENANESLNQRHSVIINSNTNGPVLPLSPLLQASCSSSYQSLSPPVHQSSSLVNVYGHENMDGYMDFRATPPLITISSPPPPISAPSSPIPLIKLEAKVKNRQAESNRRASTSSC